MSDRTNVVACDTHEERKVLIPAKYPLITGRSYTLATFASARSLPGTEQTEQPSQYSPQQQEERETGGKHHARDDMTQNSCTDLLHQTCQASCSRSSQALPGILTCQPASDVQAEEAQQQDATAYGPCNSIGQSMVTLKSIEQEKDSRSKIAFYHAMHERPDHRV